MSRQIQVLLNNTEIDVLASQTNQVISDVFEINPDNCLMGLRVDVLVDDVTVTNAITVKLQASHDPSSHFADVDSTNAAVALATTTDPAVKSFALNPNNDDLDTDFPLARYGRLVITTGVSDIATIQAIYVQGASQLPRSITREG